MVPEPTSPPTWLLCNGEGGNPVVMKNRRRPLAVLMVVAALGVGTVISAAAVAADDDRAATEAIVREVEAATNKALAGEMLAHVKDAQARAQKLRAGGDEPRARLADGLARTWAESARDLIKAAEAEQKADVARLAANDAGREADRERALLEEAIAQSGRLRAQLEQGRNMNQPAKTSAAANDADGGARTSKPSAGKAPPKADKDGGAR